MTVISDEIHCDITAPGKSYVPFAAASEYCADISITCIAPTKCFNMAGLQTAAVMVPNKFFRHKVWRALNTDEVAEPNAFAITAAVAAFTKGEPWLEELRKYLWENRKTVCDFVAENLPQIHIVDADVQMCAVCGQFRMGQYGRDDGYCMRFVRTGTYQKR